MWYLTYTVSCCLLGCLLTDDIARAPLVPSHRKLERSLTGEAAELLRAAEQSKADQAARRHKRSKRNKQKAKKQAVKEGRNFDDMAALYVPVTSRYRCAVCVLRHGSHEACDGVGFTPTTSVERSLRSSCSANRVPK